MSPPATASRGSPQWLTHGCGAIAALAYGGLAWLNREEKSLDLAGYLAAMTVAWLALAAAWRSRRSDETARLWPAVLCWALVFRVIGFFANPVMEDDYFRYLWDGRQFAISGNPYASAPSDHFQETGLSERFEAILGNINYPHVATIYAPVLQYAFVASYWISPGALWPLKLILIAADLATALFLWRLGCRRSLLLYLWCPLLIQETAFTAHPDSIGACFAVAALLAARHSRDSRAAFWIGLATGTKITGALLAPLLLKGAPKRAWLTLVATVACLYLPFWFQHSLGDWPTLVRFAREWEFNSGGFGLLQWLLGFELAAPVAAVATGVGLGWIWWQGRNYAMARLDVAYGWFFAWSAVVQPWYLLWLLPWVVMRSSVTGWCAMVAVSLSYLTHLHLEDGNTDLFGHPSWVRWLEYGAILIAIGVDLHRHKKILEANRGTGAVWATGQR
jgi:hypothetical protein